MFSLNCWKVFANIANISKQNVSRCISFVSNRATLKSRTIIIASVGSGSLIALKDDKRNFSPYIWAGIRFIRSLQIGMMISLDYYFSMMGLNEELENYKPMMSLIHKRAATRILEGCLINGGTYIKLGQGLVSLSHILPAEYIEILSKLQDKCLECDVSELFEILEEDFGKKSQEIFKSIDCKPIAAASIAQVFKGETLHGDKVAIKVQYKDLQSRFVSDVATIDFLLKIIGFIHPNFNFDWVLTDLSSSLREELDFLKEGANAEKCAENLKGYKYIYIPKVYWDCCSSRILVTEFIDGIKINNISELKQKSFSFSDIDQKISEAFAYQIFKSGFVHADPHPGNLLIRRRNHKTEIVIIDHGLYQKVEEQTRLALKGMWRAIVLANDKEMAYYSNMLGVEDYEILAEILTQRPIKTKGFKLTTRITEEQMQDMTEMAKHRFDEIMQVLKIMPRSLLLVVRNLNTIRSIIHDHGDPIDRYAILARCAGTKSCTGSFEGKIRTFWFNWYFEFKLFTGKLWVYCVKAYLKTLALLGRSPDTSVLVADLS